MTCNVKLNTINSLKNQKLIDDNLFIINPMFFEKNREFSDLARNKYKVSNKGTLFTWKDVDEKRTKAVPNEEFFSELQKNFDSQVPAIGNKENLQYQFKIISIIADNIQKINQWYKKIGNTDIFWNKLQQDLQIPKDQVELLKQTKQGIVDNVFNNLEKDCR